MAKEDLEKAAVGNSEVEADGSFFDLSDVTTRSGNVTTPRITVSWDSNTGLGSVLAAVELAAATNGTPGIETPRPAAVKLHNFSEERQTLYGVAKAEWQEGYLKLEWFDQGRRFRTNLLAMLTKLKIKVPKGTRMVINLKATTHPTLGACVKLWWVEDCFIPINEQEDGEEAKSGT